MDRNQYELALNQIAQVDKSGYELNSVLAVSEDLTFNENSGPLAGVPILIKDNIEAIGLPATAGSLALADTKVVRDSTIASRLRQAGATIIGSTNLSEWANIRSGKSTSGWSAVGGLTANPWKHEHSAGGSSSGSGAAVAAGITTMAALAAASDDQRPSDFVPGSFDKLRKQAKLQTSFRETGKHSYVVVDDPEIGVLPPASPNDIFFDMEGFPYFEEKGGLEYLFGAITRDANSKKTVFHEFWAHDREQEANAFTNFVKFAYDRLQADPTAHVYHYAPYEVTALNKLATRHGVMEAEVDWLIGQGKMIDLYKTNVKATEKELNYQDFVKAMYGEM